FCTHHACFAFCSFFFFQAEDGIRDFHVTGVQTCALPICPPVTTTEQALEYRERILDAVAQAGLPDDAFTPLMTLYLTDNTSPDELRMAHGTGVVHAVKLYPAGATTNSDAGVTDLLGRCRGALEAMQELGMPLLVHGEVTDPEVDIFDREAVFIDRVMIPLRKQFPELKVVFEHLTTR